MQLPQPSSLVQLFAIIGICFAQSVTWQGVAVCVVLVLVELRKHCSVEGSAAIPSDQHQQATGEPPQAQGGARSLGTQLLIAHQQKVMTFANAVASEAERLKPRLTELDLLTPGTSSCQPVPPPASGEPVPQAQYSRAALPQAALGVSKLHKRQMGSKLCTIPDRLLDAAVPKLKMDLLHLSDSDACTGTVHVDQRSGERRGKRSRKADLVHARSWHKNQLERSAGAEVSYVKFGQEACTKGIAARVAKATQAKASAEGSILPLRSSATQKGQLERHRARQRLPQAPVLDEAQLSVTAPHPQSRREASLAAALDAVAKSNALNAGCREKASSSQTAPAEAKSMPEPEVLARTRPSTVPAVGAHVWLEEGLRCKAKLELSAAAAPSSELPEAPAAPETPGAAGSARSVGLSMHDTGASEDLAKCSLAAQGRAAMNRDLCESAESPPSSHMARHLDWSCAGRHLRPADRAHPAAPELRVMADTGAQPRRRDRRHASLHSQLSYDQDSTQALGAAGRQQCSRVRRAQPSRWLQSSRWTEEAVLCNVPTGGVPSMWQSTLRESDGVAPAKDICAVFPAARVHVGPPVVPCLPAAIAAPATARAGGLAIARGCGDSRSDAGFMALASSNPQALGPGGGHSCSAPRGASSMAQAETVKKAAAWRAELRQQGRQRLFEAQAAVASHRAPGGPWADEALGTERLSRAGGQPEALGHHRAPGDAAWQQELFPHISKANCPMDPQEGLPLPWEAVSDPDAAGTLTYSLRGGCGECGMDAFSTPMDDARLVDSWPLCGSTQKCPAWPEAYPCSGYLAADRGQSLPEMPPHSALPSVPSDIRQHCLGLSMEEVLPTFEYQAAYRKMYQGVLKARLEAAAPDHYED